MRIRDVRDEEAWRQFVGIYAPVVYRYARGRGLQDADCTDLIQEVLRSVAATAGRLDYDPRRGRFRGWLFTVAHHRLHDFLARSRRGSQGSGDSRVQAILEQQPDRASEADLWDREYDRGLFAWAVEQVRGQVQETTWRAFWLTAVEGRGGKEAAEELGISAAAVYLAKCRVMDRLRKKVHQIDGG